MAERSDRRRPADLSEAVRYFSDVDVANEYVASMRWPDGRVCPRCGSREHSYISTRRLWKCKACKRQFSVKAGTVFEGSTLGLDKWLPAVWVGRPGDGRELARARTCPRGDSEVRVVHGAADPASHGRAGDPVTS